MTTEIERDIGILRGGGEIKVISYCAWHITPQLRKNLQESLAPNEVLSSTICDNCFSKEVSRIEEKGTIFIAASSPTTPQKIA